MEGSSTAARNESEFAHTATWSSGDRSTSAKEATFRNSLSAKYGLSEQWEIGTFFNFEKLPDESYQQQAFGLSAKTHFFDPGELTVDTGLGVEATVPKNSDEKFTLETKFIFEKTFGKFSFAFNPAIELVQLKQADEDGETTHWEKSYAAQVKYSVSSKVQPHLDLLGDLAETNSQKLLLGQVDLKIGKALTATLGLGAGLTAATEAQVFATKLEFEIE